MPLRLSRYSRAAPACKCGRLFLCHVDRRVEWQRSQLEHSAPVPLAVDPLPEVRWLGASRVNIVNILTICDFVRVDLEVRYFDLVLRQFVIPREVITSTKGGDASRDVERRALSPSAASEAAAPLSKRLAP